MPDSLLPIQGPASYGERDLDSLLSGEADRAAVALGPVADVLDALRGAPAPDELEGEAAVRAAFRLFVLPEAGEVGGAPVPAPHYQVPAPLYQVPAPLYQVPALLQQGAAAGQGHPDGQSPTVVLPRTTPGGPRHARPRRPVPWHGHGRAMAVACGAAAAVIVFVVALAGGFSGPGGQQARPGQHPSAQAAGPTSKRAMSSVLGTPARPVPSGPSPAELCRQFMAFFTHRESPTNWAAEHSVLEQLNTLAGGWPRITGYCDSQLGVGSPGPKRGSRDGAGDDKPQGHGGHGQAAAAPRLSRAESPVPQPGARLIRAGKVKAARTGR